MWLIRLLSGLVFVVFLLANPVVAQNNLSVTDPSPPNEFAQGKSAQRPEQQRFLTWKAKGYIPVYLFGDPQIFITVENSTYLIDLSSLLQEVLSELRLETFMLPISELRLVSQPEDGTIWFGTYQDSPYLKRFEHTSTALDARILSLSYGGITFVIDKNGYALDFDQGYIDTDFDHVECLVAHPQYYATFHRRIRIADRNNLEIRIKSPIEKIQMALKSIAKHEIYHALGTKHIRDCDFRSENHKNCSIMASSAYMLFSYPGLGEFRQITAAWKNAEANQPERVSSAKIKDTSVGSP